MITTKRPHSSRPSHHISPFEELETEMFSKGVACRVIEDVRALDTGRVKLNGNEWKAQLYELNCITTSLLSGQPALVIGRKGNTLIIMPLHCLLWPQYLEEQGQWPTGADIELMSRYDQNQLS